jgi:acyl-CoA dehydrogenase
VDILFQLVIFFVSAGALAYHRAPLWQWTLVMGGVLFIYSYALPVTWSVVAAWLVFAAVATFLNVTALRRRFISEPVLRLFRTVMPAMSQTERDALEAGTVWWESELFSGKPDWRRFASLTPSRLSREEQAFIDGPVERLCEMLDDWRITEEHHDLPTQVWEFLKEQHFFGMIIPRRYGGLEFSALAHSSVVMKIAGRSISAAVTVMVPNSLGPAELLLRYGTDEQKEYYLPRLARGEEVPCFALTGPEAGSDASAIPDRGVISRGIFQGREVTGIRLNWDKRYITLGPVATVLGLAFKLYDPDHLLGDRDELGITLALIPTDTPGITIGNRHAPLSMAFQNGPNSGRDVFIPLDWIIGGPEYVGRGWRMLMECLAAGRSISLPALSVGAGKLVCRATGAYARVRRQFKMPIGHFEGVEEALAAMAGYTYMMDAARAMTAAAVDSGEHPAVASAIVKYNLTERMRHVVNLAMDVQGGSGICMGPRNFIGRLYQAIPISITVEGANILTRSLIIFGQGAIRCHPYVLQEMRAATEPDPDSAARAFDTAFTGHVGFLISNAVRALILGVTDGRGSFIDEPAPVKRWYQRITRMSAAFALAADASMLMLGGALKRREKLSGRLADCLSQLYLASAVLRRYKDQGAPAEDLPLVQWACADALYTAQQSLDGLLKNFPHRTAAALLRFALFPMGRRYSPPDDTLGRRVARLLLQPSTARTRLTEGMFLPRDTTQALGRLEDAMEKTIAAEPAEAKLRRAVHQGLLTPTDEAALIEQGVAHDTITSGEAELLRAAVKARKDAIQVDDFAPDYWHKGSSLWHNNPAHEPAGVETST